MELSQEPIGSWVLAQRGLQQDAAEKLCMQLAKAFGRDGSYCYRVETGKGRYAPEGSDVRIYLESDITLPLFAVTARRERQ